MPGVKVARVDRRCPRTSPTPWRRRTCASWRQSPASPAIGVEVPNPDPPAGLPARHPRVEGARPSAAAHPLEVAIGRRHRRARRHGEPGRDAAHPHLGRDRLGEVARACNSIVTSIVMRATPDEVRLILVDPKRVQLGQYNDLPHLLDPVVVDPEKAAGALKRAVKEYAAALRPAAGAVVRASRLQRGAGARRVAPTGTVGNREVVGDIRRTRRYDHVGAPRRRRDRRLTEQASSRAVHPVAADELNDLMMVAACDVEESVVRIAQMAPPPGIHLCSRPSARRRRHHRARSRRTSRVAWRCGVSPADSRVTSTSRAPSARGQRRHAVAHRLVERGAPSRSRRGSRSPRSERSSPPGAPRGRVLEPVVAADLDATAELRTYGGDDDDDELLRQARELVVRSQLGSTSMLQRKLRVGFARAGRLMDLLERRGRRRPVGGVQGARGPRRSRRARRERERGRSDAADGGAVPARLAASPRLCRRRPERGRHVVHSHRRRHPARRLVLLAVLLVLVAAGAVFVGVRASTPDPPPVVTPVLTRTVGVPTRTVTLPWPATGTRSRRHPGHRRQDGVGPEHPAPVASLTSS